MANACTRLAPLLHLLAAPHLLAPQSAQEFIHLDQSPSSARSRVQRTVRTSQRLWPYVEEEDRTTTNLARLVLPPIITEVAASRLWAREEVQQSRQAVEGEGWSRTSLGRWLRRLFGRTGRRPDLTSRPMGVNPGTHWLIRWSITKPRACRIRLKVVLSTSLGR